VDVSIANSSMKFNYSGAALPLVYMAHRMKHVIDEAVAPLGIRARHFAVLTVISRRGPCTQVELGDLLGIDRSSMVGVVDELEKLGMVERAPMPGNRRANAVTPMAAAEPLLERAAGLITGAEHTFFAALSAEERAELRRLLVKAAEG
jgi:DNA-binding MarR family transcriptional regulator